LPFPLTGDVGLVVEADIGSFSFSFSLSLLLLLLLLIPEVLTDILLLLFRPKGFGEILAEVLVLARVFKLLLLIDDVGKTGGGVTADSVFEITVLLLLFEIPPLFKLSCFGYM